VVGFDTRHDWRLVGVDNGYRESDFEEARTILRRVAVAAPGTYERQLKQVERTLGQLGD